MTDKKPNCENCSNNPCLWTDNTPCLSHPGAREWLMRDVVKELERLYDEETTHSSSYAEGKADGYDRVISLIRGEK